MSKGPGWVMGCVFPDLNKVCRKGNRLAQTVRLELGALIDFQDLATVFGSAEYVAKATRRIANYPSVILYTSKNEKCKSKLHVLHTGKNNLSLRCSQICRISDAELFLGFQSFRQKIALF